HRSGHRCGVPRDPEDTGLEYFVPRAMLLATSQVRPGWDDPSPAVLTGAAACTKHGATMAADDRSPVPDYVRLLRLDGRGFVVVGAGQGIGRQAAHALAAVGARVLCVDVEPERAAAVAAEVGGVAWSGDVRARAAVDAMVADAGQSLGRIHGLV